MKVWHSGKISNMLGSLQLNSVDKISWMLHHFSKNFKCSTDQSALDISEITETKFCF